MHNVSMKNKFNNVKTGFSKGIPSKVPHLNLVNVVHQPSSHDKWRQIDLEDFSMTFPKSLHPFSLSRCVTELVYFFFFPHNEETFFFLGTAHPGRIKEIKIFLEFCREPFMKSLQMFHILCVLHLLAIFWRTAFF